MYSKNHLPLFPNASTVKESGPGKYVVCDIQSPFSIESIMGGERYVLTHTLTTKLDTRGRTYSTRKVRFSSTLST
jgi:hypothetical protein